MSPGEIHQRLKERGMGVVRSTLSRYASLGIIPKPTLRSLGRGRGVESTYPRDALPQAIAARHLALEWRATTAEMAEVRDLVLGGTVPAARTPRIRYMAEAWRRAYLQAGGSAAVLAYRSELVPLLEPMDAPERLMQMGEKVSRWLEKRGRAS